MGIAKTFTLLAVLTALFSSIGFMAGGVTGMVLAFLVASAMNFFAYWNSDKIVLRTQGAKIVERDTTSPMLQAFLHDIEELARRADMPMPKVYIIDTQQPNAFATGRNPQNAAVAATTGLLGMLNREEVAGVMAHELAHVQNRDTLIMTVTATMAGAIGMLARFGMYGARRGGRGGLIGGLAMTFIAPMAAGLVQMAISRSREFVADRRGAEICGNPLWLANALEKIERGGQAAVNAHAEKNPAMAHMYISNPLSGRAMLGNLFSTHPVTAHRIAKLHEMADEMGLQTKTPAGPWG